VTKVQTNRWSSFSLIRLGLLVPLFYDLYLIFYFHTELTNATGLLSIYAFQWLPFTTFSWTAAGFLLRGRWWQSTAGVVMILGTLASLFSYVLFLRWSLG
jgi:hypothetical protein